MRFAEVITRGEHHQRRRSQSEECTSPNQSARTIHRITGLLRGKAISDSRLGNDVARIESVDLDFSADVGYVDAKVLLRIPILSARPNRGEELSMCQRLARV